ncbi:T9SS type A sorting domain-containing protein [candidate division WOR-3 bacterium]|nr:T9SS type A sorting domain-containing protein [candidate division WOR-3 bacterium]
MKLGILIIALTLAGRPIAAQNTNFLLDTNLAYIPAPRGQSFPSVTFNGTDYFCMWYDWRNMIADYNDPVYPLYYSNIYGCRISPDGILLDSAGIPISYRIWEMIIIPWATTVTSGSGLYLPQWQDFLRGNANYAARVSAAGAVLDPDGFAVCTHSSGRGPTSIAYGEDNFFAVWMDQRTPTGIYGCRIHADGTVIDPEGIFLRSVSFYDAGLVSIASRGTQYLAVWSESSDIYAMCIDTAGTIIDTSAIAVCTNAAGQAFPSVVFGHPYYFVVWYDERANGSVRGARIDSNGVLIDTIAILITDGLLYPGCPSLDFDGARYLVTWAGDEGSCCARVDTDGVLLDPVPITVPLPGDYNTPLPSVAYGNESFLLVSHTFWGWSGDVMGMRVDTSGNVLDTSAVLYSMAGYSGRNGAGAHDGEKYFVVWEDTRDASATRIIGTRIDTAGCVLDPDGISIIDGTDPAVAYGTDHLVLCTGLKAVRIGTGGAIIDTISDLPAGGTPAVIFDGVYYFVAYRHGGAIYAARLDAAGSLLDTLLVGDTQYNDVSPAIAFDGSSYFIVWNELQTLYSYVCGARVSSAGVLLDTIPIRIANISGNSQYGPAVAFDGVNYVVVWRGGDADIYGARVSPQGIVLDPTGFAVCMAPSRQGTPRIQFDGQNYCVVWYDWRSGSHTDIYGCYLTPAGEVMEEFTVAAQPGLQVEPDLVRGLDKYLIIYSGFIDTINGRPANTMRVWGNFQDFTGATEFAKGDIPVSAEMNVVPNPFKTAAKIRYSIPDPRNYAEIPTIVIYDVIGRSVISFDLKSSIQNQGSSIVWDGTDHGGRDAGAGVYFCFLKTGQSCIVQKMVRVQ